MFEYYSHICKLTKMEDIEIPVIYKQQMRKFVNIVKDNGLDNNGIIYGGLVRDEIIGNHYRQEFINKGLNFKDYWKTDYNPETNKRLIIPNDIDIFFPEEKNSQKFIDSVKESIRIYNGGVSIRFINRSENMFSYISSFLKLKHHKLSIYVVVGRTLCNAGKRLRMNVDILTTNTQLMDESPHIKHYMSDIEPPFYNLDFLCNVFIMQKINNRTNIRISNCTGTRIDTMSFSKKIAFSSKITTDIINGTTQFVRNDSSNISELINCYRILKLIDRVYSWNITNIPFNIFTSKDIKEAIECTCYICLEDIKLSVVSHDSDDSVESKKLQEFKYVSLSTTAKTQIFHYRCFMSFLYAEKNKKYINTETNKIECRCPLRTPFNFKKCYEKVSYD